MDKTFNQLIKTVKITRRITHPYGENLTFSLCQLYATRELQSPGCKGCVMNVTIPLCPFKDISGGRVIGRF